MFHLAIKCYAKIKNKTKQNVEGNSTGVCEYVAGEGLVNLNFKSLNEQRIFEHKHEGG